MERRLAAVMFADIVGYARLMGADQNSTMEALRQLRQKLFDPTVHKYRGDVVKRLGDGWIVEFPSITDAVNCAQEIQNSLLNHEMLKLRIGIHTGEIFVEEDDVFGDGVNVAARLETIARPGQVVISGTAQNGLDGRSAADFEGGDTLELKNIDQPTTIWRWSPSRRPETRARRRSGRTGGKARRTGPPAVPTPGTCSSSARGETAKPRPRKSPALPCCPSTICQGIPSRPISLTD